MKADPVTIAQISHARRLLAEAKDLDDIKAVRDMAEAARLYARAAGLGSEAINAAAEIKLRAERAAGEALREMEKQHGARTPLRDAPTESRPPRLADIGITPKQSMHWQAEASVPEPVFEAHIEETKAEGKPLTTAGVVRLARPAEPTIAEIIEDDPSGPDDIRAKLADHARATIAEKAWHVALAPAAYERIDPDSVVATQSPLHVRRGVVSLERSIAYLTRLLEAATRATEEPVRLEVMQ